MPTAVTMIHGTRCTSRVAAAGGHQEGEHQQVAHHSKEATIATANSTSSTALASRVAAPAGGLRLVEGHDQERR